MNDTLAIGMTPARAIPVGNGVFVAVVGPSGAGKDTVIDYARDRVGDLVRPVRFIRRVITRPADTASEDHDSLDPAAFTMAEQEGAFAITWSAHGLRYGLPAETDGIVGAGTVAVANLSRTALPALRARYANVVVAGIIASRETLAARLAARGRETHADILARLARTPAAPHDLADAVTIANDGAPEVAGEAFLDLVRAAVLTAAARERAEPPRPAA